VWWLYWPGPPAVPLTQTGYFDDGDHLVSVGDTVALEELRYPIGAVQISYFTEKYYDDNSGTRRTSEGAC
jgi:hypothetical protein